MARVSGTHLRPLPSGATRAGTEIDHGEQGRTPPCAPRGRVLARVGTLVGVADLTTAVTVAVGVGVTVGVRVPL